ncbi:glycosyltransferase [Zymomonas mobilis]|uniref:glycosyltransferase n=1 Tax=Zymomonas mobilis TaxID=542 RepID=UPI0003C75854|nr:glycosyltransferase [Zymomonas mobilis]AHB09438.1 glycosyltransferase [Zymomonas mobilis subsp. mobilis str. CP4 = NRRL B-14023]AHJ69744.1 Mannosylfructose-phosphate synthase [Zymomonas mobilis subsp. mobilis NRRL B-12526]AHJ71600.1 Mannosylfructose-phosphate synthase [Zymomonas mobilis subsp. mobilis str. CP4 = NRRL B-14023]
MRIVIDLQSCQNGSRHRGIGRYALDITKAMIRLGKEHEYLIFLTDRFPESINYVRQELDGFVPQDAIRICSLFEDTTSADPDSAWRSRAAEIIRTAFISQLQPDIVFVPSLFEGFWDNTVVSVDPAPYATAITLLDLIPLEDPDRYIPAQNDRDAYFRRLRDAQRADLIVSISSFVAEEAKKRMGIDPDKIVVALIGKDDRFHPPAKGSINRADLMKRMGITRPFIFNASPLEYRKNIEGLISGFGSMSQRVREGHQIVIAGKMDTYAKEYLKKLAYVEGLPADTIVLPGYVSDDDLINLYAECSLFVFPSFSEGFGLPPLEAMACGAPVLVANTTSLPEVVGREDLLVDPTSPPLIGAAMERILVNKELRQSLRDFGIKRASDFTWERTAQITLKAFEEAYSRKAAEPKPAILLAKRPRIAFVCTQTAPENHVAGRISGLISALSTSCDIILVCPADQQCDQWLLSQVEYRDLGWLDWNAANLDQIIYAGDSSAGETFSLMLERHPGIFLELQVVDQTNDNDTLSTAFQRDLIAYNGLGALIDASTGQLNHADALSIRGVSLSESAIVTLSERDGTLPLLPLAGDKRAGTIYRNAMGIPDNAPLIVAIVKRNVTANAIMAAYRNTFARKLGAHLVIHVIDTDSINNEKAGSFHLQGGIRHVAGSLNAYYRGMLSTSDMLLIGSDIPKDMEARLIADGAALDCDAVSRADQYGRLDKEITNGLKKATENGGRSAILISPADVKPAQIWAKKITETITQLSKKKLSLLEQVEKMLPGSVRGKRANSLDLGRVSLSIANNLVFEREPLIYIDITAYAAPGSIRRLSLLARKQLYALLSSGGKKIRAIFDAGGYFVVANQFVANLVGINNFYIPDENLIVRPGDRIVGIEHFFSFSASSFSALQKAQERGAAVLFFSAGKAALMGGYETSLADVILAWVKETTFNLDRRVTTLDGKISGIFKNNSVQKVTLNAQSNDMPIEIFVLDNVSTGKSDQEINSDIIGAKPSKSVLAAISDFNIKKNNKISEISNLHYTVMGHLLGNYSLAIVNRTLAKVLENNYPGKTNFLPFEVDPIFHTEGVPLDEKQLMIDLCARPRENQDSEVLISHHWPVMKPQGHPKLAIALFYWEESHIPSDIVDTFNSSFDAIMSPAQSGTDALNISGVKIPKATIGPPVDLSLFQKLAQNRQIKRPIKRFLHISSCFPRKGVDVLLAAWAKAFTIQDDVILIIKTFSNPHNNVQEQVDALRQKQPDIAPIKIIFEDVDKDKILNFYENADVMVLPTRGEGYNLPAIEAMAAGLPLIVTGYGGHRDFCGPQQARMIQFHFAHSGSHVKGTGSMWVEPDIDDLALALQEYADIGNADVIEKRRQNALMAANVEGDPDAWIQRFSGMIGDLLEPRDMNAPRVGWVSTWQIKCGIAQYSGYLLEQMSPDIRRNITIFCDDRTQTSEDDIAFEPIWKLIGNKSQEISEASQKNNVEALIIQHQDGLISWEQLGKIGHDPKLKNIVTVVILHNARNLRRAGSEEAQMVIEGLSKMTRVLVHNIDDMNFLLSMGLYRNLGLFPHGAFAPTNTPTPRAISANHAPIIGCHGFFFRHKGIDKLILSAAKLRRQWPGLRLRLVNARFPGEGHDQIISECKELAAKVGMQDAIDWHLDFLPRDEIEQLLSECDLIVLPYDESDDSASGAIRTALTTMVPLIATRVKIFAELGDSVAWAENNSPEELSRVMADLLEHPEKRRDIQVKMHEWLHAHDWKRMATILEDMITGLVQQQRLGWNSPRNHLT